MRSVAVPMILVLSALGLSAIILIVPGLLSGFLAAFTLTCLLPGIALTHCLSGQLGLLTAGGTLHPVERAIVSIGAGYVLLIAMPLALIYLPIPFSRESILVAFVLLVCVLAVVGVSMNRRGSLPTRDGRSPVIPRQATYAALLVAVVALVLRLPSLGYSEFMGDEAKVLLWATDVIQGRGDAIFLYRKGPGEILISALFYALLGRTNELVARLPFTIANAVAMVTIFQLGHAMFEWKVGLAAGLLASVEGFFVALSRMVQYQSLVILLGCVSVWLFYRFYRGSVAASPLLGAITLAAGFLCHWDMVFAVPVVAYLLFEALRSRTTAIRRHRPWLIVSVLLASALLAAFVVPFFVGPHFEETSQYLAKRVRASRLPYFHLPTFFDYGTTYNSTYYSAVLSLLVLSEVACVAALSLRRTRLSLPARVAILALVPVALFTWIGLDHPGRVACLAGVLSLLILVVLSDQRVETKAVCIWFFVPFVSYAFVIRLPLLHIYNLSMAVSLLSGTALVRALGLLRSAKARRVTIVALGLWYLVSANYIRMVFLQTSPEYLRSYPAYRHPAYWTFYGDTLPKVSTQGFPYAVGWKVVGALYQKGVLRGDYDSNEEEMVTQWYTRGAVRCGYGPRYYILAEHVKDEQPVPIDDIADNYTLISAVSVRDRTKLRIYERTPAPQEEADHHRLKDWASFFDGEVSKPQFFTDVPRTDPVASVAHPLDVRFDDHLRVLGYDLLGSNYQPGDYITLEVYWQMLEPLASGHRIFIHLGWGEDRWGQRDIQPGCGLLSDSDWVSGKVIRDRYSFRIAPHTPPGWYPLRLGMYRLEATLEAPQTVPILDPQGRRLLEDDIFLTKIQVGEPEIEEAIEHPLRFSLGEGAALLGYDLAETEIARGGTVHLTLYWQSRKDMPVSYTVFTHLVDEQGHIQSQVDSIPDGGQNPTHEWVPGEVIVDQYEIPVSDDAVSGLYTLRVGMYNLLTGQRLPVQDEAGLPISGGYVSLNSVYVME